MDFFDKVSAGINKGIASVSTSSKIVVEKSKINSEIKTLEDEKKQLENLLGIKVYHMVIPGITEIPVSEIESLCKEISSRVEQIDARKKRLEELDNEKAKMNNNSSNIPIACSCGGINPADSKFCVKCGKRIGS